VTDESIGTLRLTSRGCFHHEQTTIEFERRSEEVQARITVVRERPKASKNVGGVRVISTPTFRDFAERLRALVDAASVRGRFTSTTLITLSVDLDVDGTPFRCSLDDRADIDGMSLAYAGPAPIEALVQSFVGGLITAT
jgi:hypothetical protein